MNLITFNEAFSLSKKYNKKHLLLGNGFSIACIPSIFTYGSLYSKANFNDIPEVQEAFNLLGTQDFELVIKTLENSSKILPAYLSHDKLISKKMLENAQKLKDRLIETIARNHPGYPGEIDEYKYVACSKFLSKFLDENGTIYSLNYDLLLYWALMYGMEHKLIKTIPQDGFGRVTDFEDGELNVSDYLTWQGDSKAHNQNIHYLHGALHLYDKGPDVEKFTWNDTGIRLVDQARIALMGGRFPLFVAEGESNNKLEKITHSGYLYHSYKSFSSTMKIGAKGQKNCLFTYGVSFSENDDHILCKISKGKIGHLFVSIYGDLSSILNKQIIALVERLKRKRDSGNLEVSYYQAETAKVWG
ncbi:MAG TPA: DUF4917 family protein [Saprospiraceae bacterium]|nr:DUF4917 family protein [Saprospiraceae bacterium]